MSTTECWPVCAGCGKDATHFINHELIVCDYCYCKEEQEK